MLQAWETGEVKGVIQQLEKVATDRGVPKDEVRMVPVKGPSCDECYMI